MDRIAILEAEISVLEAKNRQIERDIEAAIKKSQDDRFYNDEMIANKRKTIERYKNERNEPLSY